MRINTWQTKNVAVVLISIGMSFFIVCSAGAKEVKDHRIEVKIGQTISVANSEVGVTRGMMSMARASDGTIYLATQNVLFRSNDHGHSWDVVPVHLPNLPPNQVINGMGVSRSGRLFLTHQNRGKENGMYGQSLYVSYSDDGGAKWTTSETDFRQFGPGTPNIHFHEDGCRTFVEQPDGTIMFTTTVTPAQDYRKKYPPTNPPVPPNFGYGGQPGDLFSDIVFRSTDGGVTWGDATQVFPALNPHESALAIDSQDGDHLLIMTRVQHGLRHGENAEEMMKITGNPKPRYKQGALFESTDGGRTFQLAKGGLTSWYGHRGSVSWADNGVVVVNHQKNPGNGESRHDRTLVARISLDAGKNWVDGTRTGTSFMNQSTKFVLATDKALTAPTVSISPDHFVSAYFQGEDLVNAVLWHIERKSDN